MPLALLLRPSAALFAVIVALASSPVGAQDTTTSEPVCASTGPTCIEPAQCASISPGPYQWCGGCSKMVQCNAGQGELHESINPLYRLWDDYKKSFQDSSTTCTGCYFECPPGSEVPPGNGGLCDKTGPMCVDAPQFCNTLFATKAIQYCAGCKSYINCVQSGGASGIINCPDGTFFDQLVGNCTVHSTTCVECYSPCDAPSTTTTPATTTTEPNTIVTEVDSSDETGDPGDALSTPLNSGGSGSGGAILTMAANALVLGLIGARLVRF